MGVTVVIAGGTTTLSAQVQKAARTVTSGNAAIAVIVTMSQLLISSRTSPRNSNTTSQLQDSLAPTLKQVSGPVLLIALGPVPPAAQAFCPLHPRHLP